MNLRFNGRPVSWFGVGEPDVIGPGIATLQGKVAQYTGGGGFTPPPPPNAVAGLKAAGAAAVAVGPALDALSGNDPAVMKLTQQAWQLNKQLAGVDSSDGIGQAEVNAAKGIVDQMIFTYKQASNLASSIASKTAADNAGTATSRVNIPSTTTSPGRAPAPRGSAPSPTLPATVPDAPPSSGFVDWLVANKTAVTIGGAVAAVGSVVLLVAAAPRRRAA